MDVVLTNGENEIVIANRGGRAIRFNENTVRPMGRNSTGVRAIRLDDDGQDEVVGMVAVNDPQTETIMVVSEKGFGKRSDVEDYRITNRGGKGVKTLQVTDKTGLVAAIKTVTDEDDLMIINKSGVTLRLQLSNIRIQGRATQGVKLIDLVKRNDMISNVCVVPTAGDETDEAEEEVTDETTALDETETPATTPETETQTQTEN